MSVNPNVTNRVLKIGTRGSKLATTQAGHVRDWLVANGYPAQLHIVTTAGDVNMAPVERIGVGVFTQALRDALDAGDCDIAVHSFKDLPTAPDERFRLVVPQRQDPRDCLVARDGLTLDTLPKNATVGTSAPRRVSQLKVARPDLDIRPLRGNIDSRMGRVTSGELDAVVLAYAGLTRADFGSRATQIFDPEVMMPAPAQGALAVEARVGDADALAAIESVRNDTAQAQATAERQVLATLEAGCTAPVGAGSTSDGETLTVYGAVISLDGATRLTATATGPIADADAIGTRVAQDLFDQGAAGILGA